MKHSHDELRQAVGLFRHGLIADRAHLPPGTPGIGERLGEKANHAYTIPGTRRTRVAAETIRDWLALYRNGGFETLYPKTRVGRGRPRRAPRYRRAARGSEDRAALALDQRPHRHSARARGRAPAVRTPRHQRLSQSAPALPRRVNRIAHHALRAAAVNDARTVNAGHLEHAVAELRP